MTDQPATDQPAAFAPIAVMSFNRPDYLRAVLDTVLAQVGGHLDQRRVVLFQDGWLNAHSGIERAKEPDILACVEVFKELMPAGRVELSPHNIGVALNFDRAEKIMFEEFDADAAIFLEDDMVLAPNYFATMDRLLDVARADERIGYVAAYGHHWVPVAEQRKRPTQFVLLEHNWAFGLLRRQWLRNKPYVDQYMALVRDVDYRLRPRKEIHRLYHGWGMGCPGDSQDVTKTMACVLTGAAKLNITAVLGKYIGEQGLHMNPAEFAKRKYNVTELFPDQVPAFGPLSGADYDKIFAVQHRWATEKPCKLD